MRKTKVVRIITRLNVGGPAQHVIFLNKGLDRGNFQTLLIAGMSDKLDGDMSHLAKEKGLNFKILPQLQRELNLINDLIAFWKIFRIILKEKPDIIHTHTAKAGVLGRFAGIIYNIFAKNKAKLVHTFHGHVLRGYFGRLKTAVFTFIERLLAHFTDKIIAVSESVCKDLLERHIGNPEKIIVIPLGLELEKFLNVGYRRRAPGVNGHFKIGIIGRLVPIKNHKMFLESVKLFTARYPSLTAKFIIVGDGELRNELEDYARGLGLGKVVEFTGWLQDLKKVYSGLDIICLTSLNEGTPVSLIEAMAAAKPVVATDVGGVKDLLTGDALLSASPENFQICERGILVKSCDAKAFVGGMRILAEDRNLRDKMGRTAREFAKTRFSKERLLSDIEDLYPSLMERRR